MRGQPEPDDAAAWLEQAIASVQVVIDAVPSDQMDLTTPCPGWDAKTVIGRLTGGTKRAMLGVETGAVVYGEDPPVSQNTSAIFAAAASGMLAAMRRPGAMEQAVVFPFATFSGEFGAGLATLDLLSHGWDIARATGQPVNFDPALCAHALDIAQATLDWAGDERRDAPWAAATTVADDAPAVDRLMAFVGRQV